MNKFKTSRGKFVKCKHATFQCWEEGYQNGTTAGYWLIFWVTDPRSGRTSAAAWRHLVCCKDTSLLRRCGTARFIGPVPCQRQGDGTKKNKSMSLCLHSTKSMDNADVRHVNMINIKKRNVWYISCSLMLSKSFRVDRQAVWFFRYWTQENANISKTIH